MRQLALCLLIVFSFHQVAQEPIEFHQFIPVKLKNKLIKIAVIDTGFNLNDHWPNAQNAGMVQPSLCSESEDFSGLGLQDDHGHGTHIAGLISKYADNANYCLVILKYWNEKDYGTANVTASVQAFIAAIYYNVDIINYSGGGQLKSESECEIVKEALNKGIKIVAAAGNEGVNLDLWHYYPANCDDRITVVENVDRNGKRSRHSNFAPGKTVPEIGINVLSLLPNGQYGYMTGTSQATAIVTGKLVKKLALELVNDNR